MAAGVRVNVIGLIARFTPALAIVPLILTPLRAHVRGLRDDRYDRQLLNGRQNTFPKRRGQRDCQTVDGTIQQPRFHRSCAGTTSMDDRQQRDFAVQSKTIGHGSSPGIGGNRRMVDWQIAARWWQTATRSTSMDTNLLQSRSTS